MVSKKLYNNTFLLLLVLIISVGAVLRFWDFSNIQFMHDELSALFRLQFDNLHDVIKYGVVEGDTHPAGVQVFLYFWTMLFGFSEMAVKLPFVIAGITSIWLSYLIGKIWFDRITGLFTAVMISSTQFFVMYSQTARPYVSGLFLTLLMVYFWSLYFFEKRKTLYLILYVLFSALSAYNHHFSLLFAAIVGFTGVFLIDKQNRLPYIIAGISIFVLYIPHLSIFFAQLNKGGIGYWLAKPESTFILEFVGYLLHSSIAVILSLVLVVTLLVVLKGDKHNIPRIVSKRVILSVWFLLPFLIGFFYSIFVSAIIQYSMLIFSTPYIYMLLFSFHRRVNIKTVSLLVVFLLSVNIITLIYQRKHYQIYYHQPYEALFTTSLAESDDVTIIDDCVDYYHQYYFEKYNYKVPFLSKKNMEDGICVFDSLVGLISTNKVVTHALSGEELQIVQKYFPYQKNYNDGFTYEVYTFSKNPDDATSETTRMVAYDDFDGAKGKWKDMSQSIIEDTAIGGKYYFLENQQWGPSVSIELDELLGMGIGILDFSANVLFPDSISKVLLVVSIYDDNGKAVRWYGKDVRDYCIEVGKWNMVIASYDLHGFVLGENYEPGYKLKANIWNVSKTNVCVNNLRVSIRPLNRSRYALY